MKQDQSFKLSVFIIFLVLTSFIVVPAEAKESTHASGIGSLRYHHVTS